jgi:hypothetical protein
MNKLIIGLLIVAAGTGVFFLLRKKKDTTVTNGLNKEWIVGKWKQNAGTTDTSFSNYQFDFQKDGHVIRSLNDSVTADTTHYEWNKANDLVWMEKHGDSTGKTYAVLKLTPDSLQVQSADSSTMLFTKLK